MAGVLRVEVARRLKGRPYYAYLYAVNVLRDRLPSQLEEDLLLDPRVAYLYARDVVGGRLPDFVHNGLVMCSSGGWVARYLEFLSE